MNLPITKSMISILFFNDFTDSIFDSRNHRGQVTLTISSGR